MAFRGAVVVVLEGQVLLEFAAADRTRLAAIVVAVASSVGNPGHHSRYFGKALGQIPPGFRLGKVGAVL